MDGMQQTVFHNLAQETTYKKDSKVITDKHLVFPKYRQMEIENEFDNVDLHHKGKLPQQEIVAYLSDKYEWVNLSILKSLFATMRWDEQDQVTKQEFTTKYLQREKALYHEINGLRYYRKWCETMQSIFQEEKKAGKPKVYFYTQIKQVELYYESKKVEWMDLKIEYEDHDRKVSYDIYEDSHEADHPSFEVWLPAQRENFFLRFSFLDSNEPTIVLGQAYLSIPLAQRMSQKSMMEIDITRGGKKIGHCNVAVRAEPDMKLVEQQLKEIKSQQLGYHVMIDDKVKEYEYLQFLWGVRNRAPHAISPLDVKWMLNFRLLCIVVLGLLGLAVHVLGRCEPMVLVVVFLMLKARDLVLLRHQKFLISWLTLSAILIDIIWISIASSTDSQINFISLGPATIVTYVLLISKSIFFIYMLVAEKSFTSDQ